MRRSPLVAAGVVLATGALVGCGDAGGATPGDACTEFSGQEETIGIRHGLGLEPDGATRAAAVGQGSTPLGDLVLPGDGTHQAVLTVFDSKWTGADVGLSANAVIAEQVERTGSAPYMDPMKPLDVTELEVAGSPAHRATLTTTDDFVYTAWLLPGEERALEVVLAQTKDSAAEHHLAAGIPDLIVSGGC